MVHYSEIHAPTEQEIKLACESSRTLSSFLARGEPVRLHVEGMGNVEVELPPSAFRVIVELLSSMAQGRAVTLVPIEAELTTQQAADFLGVSRKFLIDQLLEKNKIPFRKVGSHRRILFGHLTAYKQENEAKRLEAIDAMVAHDQKLGLFS
jgi:excisionase family DNA binding protein